MARGVVPEVGLGSGSGSGLAAAVAVVFAVGSSTINRSLTELDRAVLGNIGPRSVLPRPSLLLCGTLFIMWHSVSDSKMHFRWLALKHVRLLYPVLKFRKCFNLFSFL